MAAWSGEVRYLSREALVQGCLLCGMGQYLLVLLSLREWCALGGARMRAPPHSRAAAAVSRWCGGGGRAAGDLPQPPPSAAPFILASTAPGMWSPGTGDKLEGSQQQQQQQQLLLPLLLPLPLLLLLLMMIIIVIVIYNDDNSYT